MWGIHSLYVGKFGDDVYCGYNALHINTFTKLVKALHPDVLGDWKATPRGRVVYNISQKRFEILMDPCLNFPEMLDDIKREYKLPAQFDVDTTDDNYRCAKCIS